MKISTMATLPSLPPRSHTTAPKNTQRDGGFRLNIKPEDKTDIRLMLTYIASSLRELLSHDITPQELQTGSERLTGNPSIWNSIHHLLQEKGVAFVFTPHNAITFKE
jgi:hypothetical protein